MNTSLDNGTAKSLGASTPLLALIPSGIRVCTWFDFSTHELTLPKKMQPDYGIQECDLWKVIVGGEPP